ncbi:hypothetical protein K7432_010178 [Basidiobolus ranarum]
MVHLETLCSSMHTMLEFQNSTYFDVKHQLNEINRSIRDDESGPRDSRVKQRLSMVLSAGTGAGAGTGDAYPDDQVGCESTLLSDTGECDDLGYNRVCNMLEHLLSDAKIAIEKVADEVNYREESDEELVSSGSLVSPVRSQSNAHRRTNTISVIRPRTTQPTPEMSELRVWCRLLRSGFENQPYEIRRRWILPDLKSESNQQQNNPDIDLDVAQLKSQLKSPLFESTNNQSAVFSMIYWTLCFTLGVLLLDRYLVELASRQVTLTMESLLPGSRNDFSNPPVSEFDDDDIKKYNIRDKGVPVRRNSM